MKFCSKCSDTGPAPIWFLMSCLWVSEVIYDQKMKVSEYMLIISKQSLDASLTFPVALPLVQVRDTSQQIVSDLSGNETEGVDVQINGNKIEF